MSVVEPAVRRWTAAEYHRAAEAGVFPPGERLELIDGEIYRMSPQKSLHTTGCELAEESLRGIFGTGYVVRGQKPLALGAASEPEPDVAVVRGRIRDFATQHPSTALLVVEVADSTAAFDTGRKAEMYARAGIPDYWVVVLPERALLVHRDPDPASGQYRSITRHEETGTAAPLAAPGAIIRVADLLP